MSTIFLEKNADEIYEYLEDSTEENDEEEYREDRMDQMISKYGYWGGHYDSIYGRTDYY